MIGSRLAALALVAVLVIGAPAAAANKKFALVIGNSAYDQGFLPNAANDAELIAAKLESLGFEVTKVIDGDERAMETGVIDFQIALQQAGREAVGFFYYSGHGVQSNGENYLIPIGARIETVAHLGAEGVRANWILEQLAAAKNRINFVLLDACRNNPLPQSVFRSGGTGLAEMNAPVGTFVGYSTAPGTTASDGDTGNSPYAKALVEVIDTPGLPAEFVFKRVRDRVISATSGFQVPWDASSLTGEDFFFVEQTTRTTTDGDGNTVRTDTTTVVGRPPERDLDAASTAAQVELAFWNSIKDSANKADFEAYLDSYPDGSFAPIARNRLASLDPSSSALSGPRMKANYIVDLAGGGDFVSIQDAIDTAQDGEVIHVRPGVYAEDVSFTEDKRVVLIGLGRGDNRPHIVGAEFRPLYVWAGQPTIENFILEGAQDEFATVWLPGGRAKLQNNKITSDANSCLWVQDSASPIVSDNDIGPCDDHGLMVQGQAGGVFENNVFNGAGLATIYFDNTAKPSFKDNQIMSGKKEAMIVYGEAQPYVVGNIIQNAFKGIAIGSNAGGRYEKNDISRVEEQAFVAYENANVVIQNNKLHDVPSHCLHVRDFATGKIIDNEMWNCGLPPDYAAVYIDVEATPIVRGNTLRAPGNPEIVNQNANVDISQNTIEP